MASVMQVLPKDEVAIAESAWREVEEGAGGARRTVAMNGYIQVPEGKIAMFEELSGTSGIFCRCIARHRPATADPPPAI
eukprot:12236547-Alexandrium_andersonii.AAC.1